METSEFDKIVRSKLQEENNLHQQDIEKSKAFVWTQIQVNSKAKAIIIPWHYAAAAAILFLIFSSFLFYTLQQQHRSEIQLLSKKIENLKVEPHQSTVLTLKNKQLDALCSEVENLEKSFQNLKNEPSSPPQILNQIVYQTDTVFLTKKEYITEYIQTPKPEKQQVEKLDQLVAIEPTAEEETNESSDLIYPDFEASSQKPGKETASVRIKLNAFTSN